MMTRFRATSGSLRRGGITFPAMPAGFVRTALAAAVMLTMSIACSSASAQRTNISDSTFSGPQTFDATSGTAVITGNATLSADTVSYTHLTLPTIYSV